MTWTGGGAGGTPPSAGPVLRPEPELSATVVVDEHPQPRPPFWSSPYPPLKLPSGFASGWMILGCVTASSDATHSSCESSMVVPGRTGRTQTNSLGSPVYRI